MIDYRAHIQAQPYKRIFVNIQDCKKSNQIRFMYTKTRNSFEEKVLN